MFEDQSDTSYMVKQGNDTRFDDMQSQASYMMKANASRFEMESNASYMVREQPVDDMSSQGSFMVKGGQRDLKKSETVMNIEDDKSEMIKEVDDTSMMGFADDRRDDVADDVSEITTMNPQN